MKKVISIDLGASNGRLILAKLKDNILQLEELHRFKNEPIEKNNHLFWDINYIFQEIEKGLKKYTKNYQEPLHGIGIDTWGVEIGKHTSELQSRGHLVCRLLLEKKN